MSGYKHAAEMLARRQKADGARGWRERLRTLFLIDEQSPELVMSQYVALTQQIPTLYLVLGINVVMLSLTHISSTPWWLTSALPAPLLGVGVARCYRWMRWRGVAVELDVSAARLKSVVVLVGVLGAGFTVWALALLPYGDAYAQCHVEFFMAVTVVTTCFSLMQLRAAALLLVVIMFVPFGVVFLTSPHPAMVAIAINMLLVACSMVLALLRFYGDFAALILSEHELIVRQQETQRLSDENFRLANIDVLTSLPNRRRFFTELEATLDRAARGERCFAVALIDLDRFKTVNDMHGHAAGDRLLTQVGLRLKRLSGPELFVARLGGDEFGVILTDCHSPEPLKAFSTKVTQALSGPCVVGDRLASISCSIGVAVFPQAGATSEELFERADYALYHGKQAHKGELVVFSDEHEVRIRRAAQIEQAIRTADFETEMWVAFQPIVDVRHSHVLAFEALARWDSRELGPVGPDVFVPLAERTRMIGQLTEVLLAKALTAARGWPAGVSLCFNLSAQNLGSAETMDAVHRLVRQSGLAASRIEFEVTETALLEEFEVATRAIDDLRALGVRVALDDFGTGFSSLGYVHRLKLDKIKIDKSFVTDVERSAQAGAIIKTIVALCRNLSLDCVVEGVETQMQMQIIAGLGCHHMQGYFVSKPVTGDVVTRLIERINANADAVREGAAQ
ncbi:bifunctional diguanylate cyclase/phosphodiesterase [Acidocella sp.]|uniref:putative bifunctional diguanylate cyclase/phosphodiesterase n=1 Tax=Acidocella sp. TaxID=50710 RepID=UPI002625076E|nr:EAL domain-containing protein [Acidocella sp.]